MRSELASTRPGGFDIRPASAPEAIPVADDIWMSPGLSNSYLVVTREGRVVINAGMAFEAPVHRRNYDAVDDAPIRYLLLTQAHVDHIGGIGFLADEDTEIVAQKSHMACRADDARIAAFRARRSMVFFREAVTKGLAHAQQQRREGAASGARPARQNTEPTLTFDDRHHFELGGVRFELLSVPGGETLDSMCVWLPERGTAFIGNQLSALFPHVPNLVTLRGDKLRFAHHYLESLERLMSLEPELLLTGHFDPVRGRKVIRAELARLRDAVSWIHEQTLAGMNAGKDVATLMREVVLPDHLEVGEGYGKVSWNVRAIWEGYAGWFHYRSTSELYPVPASAVHGDLVELAGGADAVAARAAARVRAGEPVEAIQLAEVALTVAPRNREALEAFVAAHELLLERTGGEAQGNFWEIGWLRHQIAEARGALGEE